MVTLDLYDYYSKRFMGYDIVSKNLFYGLLRIILACDAAHDFMAERGFKNDNEKNTFIKAISNVVTDDLESIENGLVNTCQNIINYGKNKVSGEKTYFMSDTIAKGTVDRILSYLGLNLTSLNEIGYGDCTGDFTITRMVKLINFANKGVMDTSNANFHLRVDATQNTLDMLPIYSAILNEAKLKESKCSNINNLILGEDITSVYDAANADKLQRALKDANFTSSEIRDMSFNITCGNYNVVQCNLKTYGTKNVTLEIFKYFTKKIEIRVSNDKVGQESNNSVKGLVNLMNNKIQEDPLADKKDIYYKYSIAKTLGDFLQIISFINIPGDNKMFISADILSTKICSLFSKASFIEKIKSNDYLLNGMGIYMTSREIDRQSAASQLLIMAGSSKRQRQEFGKNNKMKYMSIEELKTKLKTVGISVTKLNSKGKKIPLTRKEMEKKASMFKKLQIRAKKYDIKIMYKSKIRGYVYKTYTRLMNEINNKINKNKNKNKFG